MFRMPKMGTPIIRATKPNSEQIKVVSSFCSDQVSVSLSDYRVGLQQSWHSHEQPILILILAGYVREQAHGEDVTAGPLQIGLKPAGIRHTDHFWDNGVRALRISIAPSLCETVSRTGIVERWGWTNHSHAVSPLLRLAHGLRQRGSQESELMGHLHEALAALLPPMPAPRSAEPPYWLRQARDHLDASYSDGIRLAQLALQADVHPVYFARQFRQFFHCSVGRYVRQLQFRAAASLMAGGEASLAEVACRIGFSDQAHMTRTFTSEFGVTPGQFRQVIS